MLRQSARGMLTLLFSVIALGGAARVAYQRDASMDQYMGAPVILAQSSKQEEPSLTQVSLRTASPLVEQARQFGHYLNAPSAQRLSTTVKPEPSTGRFPPRSTSIPAEARPHRPSPKFEVRAISIYPARPEMSMALIAEPGIEARWVKCGATAGHLSIEAIHREYVVWRNGEQTDRITVTTASTDVLPMRTAANSTRNRQERHPRLLIQKETQSTSPPRIKSKSARRGLIPRP